VKPEALLESSDSFFRPSDVAVAPTALCSSPTGTTRASEATGWETPRAEGSID
jgi:hypothetical protein